MPLSTTIRISIWLTLLALANVRGDGHTPPPLTRQEEANERANAGAMKLMEIIPRYGGDSQMDKEDFTGEDNTYLWGIISLIAIPVIFVGLSVLVAPLWALCRCCKCCCCKKKEPKQDITSCQIYCPLFLILTSMVAVTAMAAIGYGANLDFSGALLINQGSGEDGNLFDLAENLMVDASSKMNEIQEITVTMDASIRTAVDNVQAILNDTSILTEGVPSLIDMLSDISALWTGPASNVTSANGEYTFACEFCSTFGDEVADITTEIRNSTDPILDELDQTVSEIQDSLIGVEGEILNQTAEFLDTISEVSEQVEDAEEQVVNSRERVERHNGHRESAYDAIFGIPLVSIVFLLFGGVLKKPMCFTLAYCNLWFSCTLMWALLAVHLPVAVLLNDACDFLDVVDQNVSAVIDDTPGKVLDACLTEEPLVEVLGLSAMLNFTDAIPLLSLGNISSDFQFEQLDEFEEDAFNTDFTTFYAQGDSALTAIYQLTSASTSPWAISNPMNWTRNNIDALNSSRYYPAASEPAAELDNLQGLLLQEEATIAAFQQKIDQIQANMTAVNIKSEWLTQSVQQLVNNVDNASALLDPLFVLVNDMESAAECGFVGSAYLDTKAVMCSSVLGALSRIVVSMFIIAVLTMFGCCWSIKLGRRTDWWQEQKRLEKDEKLQKSMQPRKPSIILMQQARHGHGYQQPGYGYGAQI